MRRWDKFCQVAISVTDLNRTIEFYENVLGYVRNGGANSPNSWFISRVQGYEGIKVNMRWMSDRDPGFHLEFFEYENPMARPMPEDARPSDIGYSRMGIWVEDFDAALSRFKEDGVPLISEPKEYSGGRRVCVRDPNGVYLEIMEQDIRNSSIKKDRSPYKLPVETRSLTLSVPDLEQAERYFVGVLGMQRADITLHTPQMEEVWGLDGAETRSTLLWCDDFLLELVEYLSPEGRPRHTDWHMGDAGLYHFALRFRKGRELKRSYQEAYDAGHSSVMPLLGFGFTNVVYMKSDQGFIVEYCQFPSWADRFNGLKDIGR